MAANDVGSPPVLSVVLATYNRADRLRSCLDALGLQTASPLDYEVIVVDDGSTDHTGSVLSQVRSPHQIKVLTGPNRGQAKAANRGIQAARGRFVLFVDDDILVGPEFIGEHIATQTRTGGAVVMGRLDLSVERRQDGLSQSIAIWWSEHYRTLETRGLVSALDCYGGNLSAPTDALRTVGGFDVTLMRGYDAELAYRLHRLGLPLIYAPKACGLQTYDKGWRDIARDFVKEGIGGASISRRHPELLGDQMIGNFNKAGVTARLLKRFLLSIRFPVMPIAWIGSLLPAVSAGRSFHRFVQSYAYWRGVQETVTEPEEWRALFRQPAS
jgi:glycosyltransferase involved in cell wall biosynthesis